MRATGIEKAGCAISAVVLLLWAAFWGTVIWVVWHFVSKWW